MVLPTQVENRLVVKRSFSRAIIHIKHLSKEKVDLLLRFMMDNLEDIFKVTCYSILLILNHNGM